MLTTNIRLNGVENVFIQHEGFVVVRSLAMSSSPEAQPLKSRELANLFLT